MNFLERKRNRNSNSEIKKEDCGISPTISKGSYPHIN
jgi:hypothetical protein